MRKKTNPTGALGVRRSTVRRLAPGQLVHAAAADEARVPVLPTVIATGACKRTEGQDCGCGGGNDSKGIDG